MTFVFPALLGGLLLVGVPVLLHLIMRQKPKHLVFPAFRFLVQRHRSNQRKLRLRHLLLLALRVLLIALLCLALARPKIFSEQLQLSSDRPAAVVLVFDTSMSMEYAVAGKSRLDDARQRALELLAELPEGSRVAVLDTAEPAGEWLPSLSFARERINGLRLRPANAPITSRLPEAYRLIAELEQDAEESGRSLLRLLYVFSDRTQECWDANRVKDLVNLRDRGAVPAKSIFLDVGVDKPADLAILSVELPRAVISRDERVKIRVTIQAVGASYDTEVVCRIDGAAAAERKPIKLEAGQSTVVEFERIGLAEGTHQAEITLATSDALPFSNARFVTFEVRGGRRILTIADDPGSATIWNLALKASSAFVSDVRSTEEARRLFPDTLETYQAICLLDVAKPDSELWEKLKAYAALGRGIAIIPGGEELSRESYNSIQAQTVMPATLRQIVPVLDEPGVEWAWSNAVYQHPMMRLFQLWNENPETDFVRFSRAARRYWEVDLKAGASSVLVGYAAPDNPPALVERILDRKIPRGRVLLFTTTLDARPGWNNYVESITSFYPVVAQLAMRYLAGDEDGLTPNYVCGQSVPVALPRAPRLPTYTLQGPGLSATESLVARTGNQAELLLNQPAVPGNYQLLGAETRVAAFSMNVLPGEANLARISTETIDTLLGPDAVVPIAASVSFRDAMQGHWGQPVELLPWLMLTLLLLLAVENLLANKFYRRDSQEPKPEPVLVEPNLNPEE